MLMDASLRSDLPNMPDLPDFSRRDFLTQISWLAVVAPWLTTLGDGRTSAQEDAVRVGIVGIGSRGTKLLLHLQTIPGVKITAVCDDHPPRLYEAERLSKGSKGYRDFESLLEAKDVDAVVIATPPNFHAEMACTAMQTGRDVFCEKVMALTLEDCHRTVRVQSETGQRLQIGFQRLFDVRYVAALEAVRSGRIGPITHMKAHWHRNDDWRRPLRDPRLDRRVNWRMYRDASGGLIAELAAHQIVTSNWMLGEVPARISGFGSINHWKDGRETHDNVSVTFAYPGGVSLTQTSLLSNRHAGVVEQVIGPEGTIELEAGSVFPEAVEPSPGIIQLLRDIEMMAFRTIPLGGPSWILSGGRTKGTYLVGDLRIPSPTQLELEAFVESVRTKTPMPELLEESYHASLASILANRAVDEGRVVDWSEAGV